MFSRRITHEDRAPQIVLMPKNTSTDTLQDADEIRRQMYERIARSQAMSDVEESAQRTLRGR